MTGLAYGGDVTEVLSHVRSLDVVIAWSLGGPSLEEGCAGGS